MLRNALVGLFAAALIVLAATAAAGAATWGPAIGCAIVLILILVERQRYSGQAVSASLEPLKPTSERFVDPESGRPVQVWSNKAGERAYVEEQRPEA
ncbi:MAG TPA: hypothetical protein VFW19_08845 [Allosphingosinicella sp.]|nr:hypothetical protein [Allosphingosinicella sp.]